MFNYLRAKKSEKLSAETPKKYSKYFQGNINSIRKTLVNTLTFLSSEVNKPSPRFNLFHTNDPLYLQTLKKGGT